MRAEGAETWRFCGRSFSRQEVRWIRDLLAAESLSRQELSRRVCRQLGWVNRAGRLKEMSCRVALLRMDRAGLIGLPAPRHPGTNGRVSHDDLLIPRPEHALRVELGSLRLELVESATGARWYRALMRQHHYLGGKSMAGAQLRYLLWSEGWLVGGLGFGAAAWQVSARDQWIGWSVGQREARLEWIVNNNRFLLLPWVQAGPLGSWALERVARQLPADWQARYSYRPVLLESFVECGRFEGTCYRAANWLCLGQTVGRGKLEKGNSPVLPIKQIFVRPLQPDFRAILCP